MNLKRIRAAAPDHDLKIILEGFESRIAAHAENRERIKSLSRWVDDAPTTSGIRKAKLPARDAQRLAAMLRKQRLGHLAPTFASYTFMRHYRRRFCGSVLALLDGVPAQAMRFYTLVPRTWRVRGDALHTADPKMLLQQFRTQLNRAGVAQMAGWLIAFVHGDYDATFDVFQLHLHVLTVAEKAEAIEKLRDLRVYKPTAYVKRPILARRLKSRPRQVSYHIAQGFWPLKPTINMDGRFVRKRSREQRIPEPRHAEFLMWLDRQTFTDLVWLHGCRLHRGRLTPTTKARA